MPGESTKEIVLKKIAFVVALCFVSVTVNAAAPLHRHERRIPGKFMVALQPEIAAEAYNGVVKSLAASYNLTIVSRWEEAPRGFVCEHVRERDLERLLNDPRIRYVEEDFEYEVSATETTSHGSNYLWYLDRLDETSYFNSDSTYDRCPEGLGIVAYVVDLGVRRDHVEFNEGSSSRVIQSVHFEGDSTTGEPDETNGCEDNPDIWHGTAVASLLAGESIGAAKTDVVSLRYRSCDQVGDASWIVNAIRWISSDNNLHRDRPAVVNYSGGIGEWVTEFVTLNEAVRDLVVDTGIPFFTSAENFSGDACLWAPNSMAYASTNPNGLVFTVGASSVGAGGDRNDYRWQKWQTDGQAAIGLDSGSNGGACVSAYAPGHAIYHAENGSTTDYGSHSGSSFASPLAAAVAARYMEQTGITTYSAVYDYLYSTASAVVNNVNTPEYWFCRRTIASGGPYWTTRDPNATCPFGYRGIDNTTTPHHMPPTFNESGARLIYSDMTCP